MKTIKILTSAFILLLFPFILSASEYKNYTNDAFAYSITIPDNWKKEILDLETRHFLYLSKNLDTMIKIRVFKTTSGDLDEIAHDNKWDLRKIDPSINNILETGKIEFQKNQPGKLLIFEYRSNKNRILQRTLITKNSQYAYIIECKSPTKTFYEYEDIFNTVISSFICVSTPAKEEKIEPEEKTDNIINNNSEESGIIENAIKEKTDIGNDILKEELQ